MEELQDLRPPDLKQLENPQKYLFLYYLYLRPREFFRHFVSDIMPQISVIAFWIVGIISVSERIEAKIFGYVPERELDFWLATVEDWYSYWGVLLVVGAIAGIAHFTIGCWWYSKRLQWSNIPEPEPVIVKQVYIYSVLVYCAPCLLYLVSQTFAFSSPTESILAGHYYWGAILHVLMLWSVYTSYIGAITRFEVKLWLARFWFLILPAIFYSGFAVILLMQILS